MNQVLQNANIADLSLKEEGVGTEKQRTEYYCCQGCLFCSYTKQHLYLSKRIVLFPFDDNYLEHSVKAGRFLDTELHPCKP